MHLFDRPQLRRRPCQLRVCPRNVQFADLVATRFLYSLLVTGVPGLAPMPILRAMAW